jgi:hypothetical protein
MTNIMLYVCNLCAWLMLLFKKDFSEFFDMQSTSTPKINIFPLFHKFATLFLMVEICNKDNQIFFCI